jgi:hypothetical protein
MARICQLKVMRFDQADVGAPSRNRLFSVTSQSAGSLSATPDFLIPLTKRKPVLKYPLQGIFEVMQASPRH